MSFLLDTDICSAHYRRPAGLAHRFLQYEGRLFVATITLGELFAWAYRRDDPTTLLSFIRELRGDLTVLPFDEAAAEKFGQLRGGQIRSGHPAPTNDLLIAAVALAHDLTLVTHNMRDFTNIPDLRIDDWLSH